MFGQGWHIVDTAVRLPQFVCILCSPPQRCGPVWHTTEHGNMLLSQFAQARLQYFGRCLPSLLSRGVTGTSADVGLSFVRAGWSFFTWCCISLDLVFAPDWSLSMFLIRLLQITGLWITAILIHFDQMQVSYKHSPALIWSLVYSQVLLLLVNWLAGVYAEWKQKSERKPTANCIWNWNKYQLEKLHVVVVGHSEELSLWVAFNLMISQMGGGNSINFRWADRFITFIIARTWSCKP